MTLKVTGAEGNPIVYVLPVCDAPARRDHADGLPEPARLEEPPAAGLRIVSLAAAPPRVLSGESGGSAGDLLHSSCAGPSLVATLLACYITNFIYT